IGWNACSSSVFCASATIALRRRMAGGGMSRKPLRVRAWMVAFAMEWVAPIPWVPEPDNRARRASPSEGTIGLLGRELGVVRHLQAIDEPQAAAAGASSRDFLALFAHAFLLGGVRTRAAGEEAAVLGAQIVGAPLPAAGVELPDATTGYHEVEL